ncbi:MAG: hypothetical protein ABEI27_05970 [Halobellus sp.]|uniref:hypothetical protein n=1 Tax=Halobellus sp. TaxID=1979212 RepID=UPI0035D44EA0
MSDEVTCPECGTSIDSTDELEVREGVPEVEADDDGSLHLYESRDLFLCQDCRKPLGVSRTS